MKEKERIGGDERSKPNLIRVKTERVQFCFRSGVNIFFKSVSRGCYTLKLLQHAVSTLEGQITLTPIVCLGNFLIRDSLQMFVLTQIC